MCSAAPSEEHSRLFVAVVGTAEPYLGTEACRMAQGRGSGVEWRANVKARKRRERLSYATISVLAGARTWFVQLAGGMSEQSVGHHYLEV